MQDEKASFSVSSDISSLNKVIIHKPDEGVEWVTPDNRNFLLYDDIVYLDHMRQEHKVLTDVLAAFAGEENVHDIEDLLDDVLLDASLRSQIIALIGQLENLPSDALHVLNDLDHSVLAKALIAGYRYEGQTIITPLPNFIYTRDIGAMINDHLLICHASKAPRKRENIITWFILHYHEIFADFMENDRYLDFSGDSATLVEGLKEGEATLEGGDILMLNEDHLIIGCSERTSETGLAKIRSLLFERNVVSKFSIVDIPKEEYCIHLDTIFSQVDTEDFIAFDKLISDPDAVSARQYCIDSQDDPTRFDTLEELIRSDIPTARFIKCADGVKDFQEREQWTMACNTVTVRPGVAISYDRNTHTQEAFEKVGYNIVDGEELLAAFKAGIVDPGTIEKTIIKMPAGELSRGGGGPHCLTFPVSRGF